MGSDSPKGSSRNLLYGGIAGGTAKTVTAPLERLRVIFMTQHVDGGVRYKGVWRTMVKISQEDGVRALWRGNWLNVARIAPTSALRFYCFDVYKKVLFQSGSMSSTSPTQSKVVTRLGAGGLAATTAAIAMFPLDLVRTRLTAQTATSTFRYSGFRHAVWTIYAEEGVLAFYKGISAGILGTAPYIGINFAVYDTLREWATREEDSHLGVVTSMSAGAISGLVAMTITFPADVLRKQMMMQGLGGRARLYSSMWDAIRTIAQTQGVPGFYRGLVPCYLKVVPTAAVSWGTIELCKTLEPGAASGAV